MQKSIDKKSCNKIPLFAGTYLLLFISTASGCSDSDAENSYCEENVNVLPSEDAVSELLGESGADLLAAVGAAVSDTASYANNESVLTQEPIGGTSDITISTAYTAGEIREIQSTEHRGNTEEALNCQPRLEMDVTVSVETADGALQESWPAVLYREKGADPVVKAAFDPNADFTGSFHIIRYNDPSNPEEVTGEFINYFKENAADNSGRLRYGLTFRIEGGPVGHTTHDALTW